MSLVVNACKCGCEVADTKVVNERLVIKCVACGKIRAKSWG